MKSRVNLYLPEYQPKLELLTLGAMLFALAVLLALIIAARVALGVSGASNQQKLANLETELTQQSDFVQALTNQLQQRKEDPQLLAIFAGLQSSLKDKERLKAALQDREALKSTSFSLMLRELSQQHHESLWLTRINVSEASMVFDGEATSPEAVPQWVGRLGETEYFNGKTFDEARLFRDDSAIRFSLATSRADQDSQQNRGAR